MTIDYSSGFKKAYKKRILNNAILNKQFARQLKKFSENLFDPGLRTHNLLGKMNDCWSFSVSYDCRIIFQFIEAERILLLDIGTHDDVY